MRRIFLILVYILIVFMPLQAKNYTVFVISSGKLNGHKYYNQITSFKSEFYGYKEKVSIVSYFLKENYSDLYDKELKRADFVYIIGKSALDFYIKNKEKLPKQKVFLSAVFEPSEKSFIEYQVVYKISLKNFFYLLKNTIFYVKEWIIFYDDTYTSLEITKILRNEFKENYDYFNSIYFKMPVKFIHISNSVYLKENLVKYNNEYFVLINTCGNIQTEFGELNAKEISKFINLYNSKAMKIGFFESVSEEYDITLLPDEKEEGRLIANAIKMNIEGKPLKQKISEIYFLLLVNKMKVREKDLPEIFLDEDNWQFIDIIK